MSGFVIVAVIFLLLLIGVALMVYEPISGIMGATFLAKIAAVIAAFKILSWAFGALLGPAVRTIAF